MLNKIRLKESGMMIYRSRAELMEALRNTPKGEKRAEILSAEENRRLIYNSGANVTLYAGQIQDGKNFQELNQLGDWINFSGQANWTAWQSEKTTPDIESRFRTFYTPEELIFLQASSTMDRTSAVTLPPYPRSRERSFAPMRRTSIPDSSISSRLSIPL